MLLRWWYALAGAGTLLLTPAAITAVEVTKANFDEITKGKTVFLKFFAPWCGHCQELAPKWEKLSTEWEGHAIGLVGEINCAIEKDLCDEYNINGLPTLLYGEPSYNGAFLEEYHGDKEYEPLSKFATEKLVPTCSLGNLDVCDDETRKNLLQWYAMPEEELVDLVTEMEDQIEDAERMFKVEFNKMQVVYDRLSLEKEIVVAKIRSTIRDLKWLQTTKE